MNGGRFEFDDGGSYCGGWEEAKAHGHGVCTGPQSKGEYAGAWHYGFEVSGVYTWPSGNTYAGQWQNGKRHGLGVEQRGRWLYRGDWTSGSKGRYGVRSSTSSQAKYAGTWSANYHDGYGTEVYVDGGMYQGQWLRGMRHGFGVRKSAAHGVAARIRKAHNHVSFTSLRSGQDIDDDENKETGDGRGGFVLRARSDAAARRRRSLSERSLAVKRSILSGLRIKKQHSTGDIHQKVSSLPTGSLRSSGSTVSCASDDSHKHGEEGEEEAVEENVVETYHGEWKNDARCGFGVAERSDGLKYHGEWANNMKNGYGVTTLKDGLREEGKYKNNVLVMSTRKKGVLFVRSSKLRERVEASVDAATRSAEIAKQKAEIAASRTSTARERAEQAVHMAKQAREDGEMARIHAKQFDPSFKQPDSSRRHQLEAMHGLSSDSPRTEFSDHVSNPSNPSSKPPSFDLTLDTPSLYANHVSHQPPPPAPRHTLPHQSSTGSAHNYLHPHQIPDDVMASSSHHFPSTSYVMSGGGMMSQSSPLPPPNQIDPLVYNHQQQQSQFSADQSSVSYTNQSPSVPPMMSPQPPFGLPPLPPSSGQEKRTSSSMHSPSTSAASPPPSQSSPAPPSPLRREPPSRQEMQGSRMSLADDHYEQYVIRRRQLQDSKGPRPSQETNGGTGITRRGTLASSLERARGFDGDADAMGSLPNLVELEESGLRLRREDAARLASERRQQMVRDEQEREALRSNPLRYFLQPEFRALLSRWKVPLLLAAANFTLLLLFYSVVSYERKRSK